MDLRDLTSALPGRRRRRKGVRADAPRTIVPEVDLSSAAAGLRGPRGATAPAGPLDAARIDAARARLRREIAPVDDELD